MSSKVLTVRDFTDLADPLIADFKKKKPDLIVSDVLDEYEHQYVNLVQKGGGVLGIALVGYTYVLEQMGIRFLRLAGTSAGAINTALLTVAGEDKTAPVSKDIIEILATMKFFSFVDGRPWVKWLIRGFVQSKSFIGRLTTVVVSMLVLFAVLLTGGMVLFFLSSRYAHTVFIVLGVYSCVLVLIGLYVRFILRSLKSTGYGLNPGDFFYDWIKKCFNRYKAGSYESLVTKAAALPVLHLRVPHQRNLEGLHGDVTFITAELVTQNKIELPRMIKLFRTAAEINSIHPAGYVRASMSIPVFFESYYIDEIKNTNGEIKEAWIQYFNEANPPSGTRFVDGGMLSNFPMSIFYNPDIRVPRLPSFGIDLDDSNPEDKMENPRYWGFGGFLGNMFNTIRYYYDKDFLLKNKMFELGVGKVGVKEYNWLNFFLSDREKLGLFETGAKAAITFLDNFDWEEYKRRRETYYDELVPAAHPA